jgi:ribosomal protein S18 acetylase RimI-like enzyme
VSATELDHALELVREVYRGRSGHRVPLPWGELLVSDDLPRVYDANVALVQRWDGDAVSLAGEIERASAAAGLRHRRALVHDQQLADRLWPQLPVPSWPWAERNLVMILRRTADRAPDPAVDVREVDLDTFLRGRQPILHANPELDDETVGQLTELARRTAVAVPTRTFVAVADGMIATYCELYRSGVVAQIEDVETYPQYRNRGFARAVVQRAVAEAERDGARITFLLANEDDWPQDLYRKLGFEAAGVELIFGRPG